MSKTLPSRREPLPRAPACVEALPARALLSISPALAQNLLDHGYEKINWKGHETFVEPGKWIVSIRDAPGGRAAEMADVASRLKQAAPRSRLRVSEAIGNEGMFRVEAPAGARIKDVRAALGKVRGLKFAEPNFAVWSQDLAEPAQAPAPAPQAFPPDDPDYRFQWGLSNPVTPGADVHAVQAWGVTAGSEDDEAVVAVIDTGVDYNHPDLVDNIWTNPGEIAGDGKDNDHNGYVDDIHGYDFVDLDAEPLDDHNHGTHVAGIIAASANNGMGGTGLAPHAKIMSLRFLSIDGFGGIDMAVQAVDYAIDMKARGVNIRVTNNSWGGGDYSEALEQAIGRSGDAGMLFVAAAGNGGEDRLGDDIDNPDNAFYPASHPADNVISVAATDSTDRLASFSNYGAAGVDLAAPGVGILSTTRNNTYTYFNGTSMAAPLVSATAVLAFGLKPDATWQQVRDAIFAGVDKLPSLDGKMITGGRLNTYKALLHMLPPAVVGRHVFYNNSAFDGRSTAAGVADDGAIAASKTALLAGQTASFANYTSYGKGINGLMVDVRNLPRGEAGEVLTADDFAFSVGTDADLLQSWEPAPTPTSISVRRGAGVDGSDRLTITFADDAVKNTWLRVTLRANDHTGLAADDVFYFGNAVGETGNAAADAVVNALDVSGVRAHLSTAPAALANSFDLNRDGRVNALDLALVRRSLTLAPLPLITLLP